MSRFAKFASLLLLSTLSCFANVSLKNGNFNIGFTDIAYPGGFEPKIERVYNSKASFRGIFGNGWGSEFEVFLEIDPDGTVTVHEYGGGADNRFVPANLKAADVEAAAEKIVRAAQDNLDIASPSEINSYRAHLINDSRFRVDQWNKYLKLGLVKPVQLPAGTSLVSDRFSHQVLVRTATGYDRRFDNAREEMFDDRGRLTRVLDRNGNYIQLSYDARNRIQIVDNYGRRITIFLNDRNLVEHLEGEHGKVATYRYDDRENLVYSKDVDNDAYKYEYDSHFNMTALRYPDGTSKELSYFVEHDNVRSVKDRDGTVTSYSYWTDLADAGHSRVTVTVQDQNKNDISASKYEYFDKRKRGGEEYTARKIEDVDGERTDTTYTESGLPSVIVRGDEKVSFEYDALGHVTRKETTTEISELHYDPKFNKVTYVRRSSKLESKDVTWARYTYDDKGNLQEAVNNAGTKVRLNYDGLGRISELVRQDGAVIRFTYDRNSKPIEIALIEGKQTDSITVIYNDSGGIEKVDNKRGGKTALKVTSAFQELLDLIRPAGIELSF